MNNEQTIALPAGYHLENDRLETVLGHGGFGITYRAKDGDLRKTVAIKEYLPREVAFRGQDATVAPLSEGDRETFEWGLERFLDEARTLARFEHPNIVGVHRFLRANGTAYLVMDYCAGESLEHALVREGTLSPERLEAMLVPLVDALEALHAAGVTHRDIKPGNIYLRDDGCPMLLDFGAARQALAQHSRSVTAMATPGYAAFEQYSTKGKQGPWTDIYGLGATLYRCVTGQRPPDASDRMLEDDLRSAVETVFDDYPLALLEQIDSALQLRPQERPQSVAEWLRIGVEVGGRQIDRRVWSARERMVSEDRDHYPSKPENLVAWRYRFLGRQGEIVEDIVTGLNWQRCCLGQTWDGRTCLGEAQTFSWDDARRAAHDFPGWRLPTIDELRSLVYCSSGLPVRFSQDQPCKGSYQVPTIVEAAFPNSPANCFWSASTSTFNPKSVWIVRFNVGASNGHPKDGRFCVRLVRGGQ